MLQTVRTPDLGTDEAEVIEVLVKVGQTLTVDTPIVLLESAKASMEVPSPIAGVISEIVVKLGDKVSEGAVLLQVEVTETKHEPVFTPADEPEVAAPVVAEPTAVVTAAPVVTAAAVVAPAPVVESVPAVAEALIHSGPAVRRLARELGVDLRQVTGSATKGRIVKEDVHAYVKKTLTTPVAAQSHPIY